MLRTIGYPISVQFELLQYTTADWNLPEAGSEAS